MSAMPASPTAIRPSDLKAMPYGGTPFRRVKDGIWEPLWGGRRVLIDVLGGVIGIRDEEGDPVAGFDLLREAVRDAARADELVLDGYLLPAPLRSSAGAEAVVGLDSVVSATDMGRQFLVGRRPGADERRERKEAARARQVAVHAASPTAFVAVDLLWLDGESLIDVPLAERKRLLEGVLMEGEVIRRTVAVRPPVEAWFAQWRALGFH
ncbi:MAG: putative ATP-dependent ligase, partial [Chloroflexi bacterium]|nr:putative ATP-dependent ligase [Chloroflexota bacterium]